LLHKLKALPDGMFRVKNYIGYMSAQRNNQFSNAKVEKRLKRP